MGVKKDLALGAVVAGAAAVAVPTVATAGLSAVGFTTSGIAAMSLAATSQAAVGNVAVGSTFAALQSLGATGGFAILGPLGFGAAATAAGGCWTYRWWYGGESRAGKINANGRGGCNQSQEPPPEETQFGPGRYGVTFRRFGYIEYRLKLVFVGDIIFKK